MNETAHSGCQAGGWCAAGEFALGGEEFGTAMLPCAMRAACRGFAASALAHACASMPSLFAMARKGTCSAFFGIGRPALLPASSPPCPNRLCSIVCWNSHASGAEWWGCAGLVFAKQQVWAGLRVCLLHAIFPRTCQAFRHAGPHPSRSLSARTL